MDRIGQVVREALREGAVHDVLAKIGVWNLNTDNSIV